MRIIKDNSDTFYLNYSYLFKTILQSLFPPTKSASQIEDKRFLPARINYKEIELRYRVLKFSLCTRHIYSLHREARIK